MGQGMTARVPLLCCLSELCHWVCLSGPSHWSCPGPPLRNTTVKHGRWLSLIYKMKGQRSSLYEPCLKAPYSALWWVPGLGATRICKLALLQMFQKTANNFLQFLMLVPNCEYNQRSVCCSKTTKTWDTPVRIYHSTPELDSAVCFFFVCLS